MQLTAPLGMAAAVLLTVILVGCSADQANVPLNNGPGADAGASPAADAGANAPGDAGAQIGDASLPSDAGAPPVDECDPVTQSGCAPPALKCVVEGSTRGTACIEPSPDDLALGAPCEGRDCEAGLACARVSTTSTVSECVKVCDLSSGLGCEALGPDFECRTRLTGTNWGSCSELPPTCDPYSQAPCARDQACQPFLRRTGTWEFRCRTAGTAQVAEACGPGSNQVCARGLACVSTPQGAAFCRRICQVNTDCENMAQCNGVVSEPPFMFCDE